MNIGGDKNPATKGNGKLTIIRLHVKAPPRKGHSHITVLVIGIVFQAVIKAATGPTPAPDKKTDPANGITT